MLIFILRPVGAFLLSEMGARILEISLLVIVIS